jgi:hypothetical protein
MSDEHPYEDVKVAKTGGGRTCYVSTFYSMADFGEAALRRAKRPDNGELWDIGLASGNDDWAGNESLQRVAEMAMTNGWHGPLDETIEVAEDAVRAMEAEHEIDTFTPRYDVAGSDVEVGLYCSGDPEHMVDYPLVKTSRLGKVLSLICSTDAMAGVGSDEFMMRGQVLTALAIALDRLGHATEFWVDMGARFQGGEYHSRILVKGTMDSLDPGMLLMAYCHPGMLRRLQFGSEDGNPVSNYVRNNRGRGSSASVFLNGLPDGMIIIPNPAYGESNAHDELVRYLRLMGLIRGE